MPEILEDGIPERFVLLIMPLVFVGMAGIQAKKNDHCGLRVTDEGLWNRTFDDSYRLAVRQLIRLYTSSILIEDIGRAKVVDALPRVHHLGKHVGERNTKLRKHGAVLIAAP